MTCPDYIKILAEGDNGLGRLMPLIIIGIIWLVGTIISNKKKKDAEAKADLMRQQKGMQNDKNEDKGGWQIIAPPPQPQKPPPPVQQPRPVPARKPSIQQFVKNKIEESHSTLIQPKAVEHLQHVEVEPLPVLHADGDLPSSHLCADDDQAQPDIRRDKTRLRQKLTPVKKTQTPAETSTSMKALFGFVHLADPKAARSAMVFHEILSSPKALRDEENMWD